jgi:hypothetical protein
MRSNGLEYLNQAEVLAREAIQEVRGKRSFQPNEILAVCFAFRILNSSSGIKLLVEGGLVHDAKSILRTMAEAVILLAGSLQTKGFMNLFNGEDLDRRSRLFKKMKRSGLTDDRTTPEDEEKYQQISQKLKQSKKIDLEKIAQELDLKYEFYRLHSACSSEVHHLPQTMDEYVRINVGSRTLYGFVDKPALEDSQLVVWSAFDCVLKVAHFFERSFKLGLQGKIDGLMERANVGFESDGPW